MKQLSLFICILLAVACSDDDDNNVNPSNNNNQDPQESSYSLSFSGDTNFSISGNQALINTMIGADTLVTVSLQDDNNEQSGSVTFRDSAGVYSPQTFVIGSTQNSNNGVVFTYSLDSNTTYVSYDGTVEITDAKSQEYIHATFDIRAVSSRMDSVKISGNMVALDMF